MKIAIPTANGRLNLHFGHCEKFSIFDVDEKEKKILSTSELDAPPHEPGLLPRWLAERDVNLVIAGGMGERAQSLFLQNNIRLVIGCPADVPENLVKLYLEGKLESGENLCDH